MAVPRLGGPIQAIPHDVRLHASTPHTTTVTATKPAPKPPAWLNTAALTDKQMQDQATTEANAAIAPQVQGVQGQQQNYDAQQKAYEAAMTGFYQALAPYMAGIQGHVSDAYNSAAQTMGDIGHGYAGVLGAGADKNTADMNAALARAGQTQAIAPGNSAPMTDAFAATNGGIAGTSFAAEGAAKATDAANKPAIWAAQGRDSMIEAINKAVAGDKDYADQIAKIYATVPALRQTILKQVQAAEIDKAKLQESVKKDAFDQNYKVKKTTFDQNYKINSFNATQEYRNAQLDFRQQGLTIQKDKYNLDLQKAIAAGARPNAALSKVYGHIVNANGDTIAGSNGKSIPVKSTSGVKPLSATKINQLQGDAAKIAGEAFNGAPAETIKGTKYPKLDPLNFGQALTEMRKGVGNGSVPLPLALKALHQAGYAIPKKYARLLGGSSGQGDPFDDTPGIQGPNLGSSSNPLVAYATRYLGVPYSWGGGSPSGPTKGTGRGANTIGYDCSSFIQAIMVHAGVKDFPRTTFAQVKVGQPVSLGQLQPGDAIFTEPSKAGPNHVGLYIGNGMVQESPQTGDVNKIIDLKSFLSGGFVAARRYLNGG